MAAQKPVVQELADADERGVDLVHPGAVGGVVGPVHVVVGQGEEEDHSCVRVWSSLNSLLP